MTPASHKQLCKYGFSEVNLLGNPYSAAVNETQVTINKLKDLYSDLCFYLSFAFANTVGFRVGFTVSGK